MPGVPILKDRVLEVTQSTGTGPVALLGPRIGHQSFATAGFVNNDTTYYTIENGVQWEVGCGTFLDSPDRVQRDIVLDSSNAGSAVVWGSGDKLVFVTLPASVVGDIDGIARVVELELMFDTAAASSFAFYNKDGFGDISTIDVWLTGAMTLKLFTRTFSYDVNRDVTTIVTLDEVSGRTLTTTFTYDGDGDVETRSKVLT